MRLPNFNGWAGFFMSVTLRRRRWRSVLNVARQTLYIIYRSREILRKGAKTGCEIKIFASTAWNLK